MDALQFETEIKGTALKTLEKIQTVLESISKKTTITIAVEGFEDFKRFIQSDDFKNIAKNISSAFGGKKAQNVEQFFTNLRNEIEKVKTALKTDDFSTFMNQIDQLTKQFSNLSTEYERFLKSTGTKTGSNLMGNMSKELGDIKGTITQTKLADGSLQQLEQTTRRAEKASRDFEKQQKKQEEQTRRTNEETNKQSSAISQLESMMGRYLSIYAVGRFASEMAQITGELELQKRSLEVIIGNASMANELYGTIRDMSQMSPYTFQDLMKSTRQLSAFGIETKDLYGTMKALSDIGAGLSVDVQRLILAYGHTRSYGYLSGIQNRQFETAGIDMIGGLADRYNRLADAEERAGRAAEHVTRKDVFKRMAKRDISFEDVNAVIMDLDREGGKFFNMQERQFETLGGKLRNLRNNYNIMMSEMGEQNKGILRAGVDLLNELTGNWEKYSKVLVSMLVPLGSFKVAMWAVNQTGIKFAQNFVYSRATLKGFEIGLKNVGQSIKKIALSSTTWVTAAIAALTALISHYISMSKEAERISHNMVESAERDAAEIDRILSKYRGVAYTTNTNTSFINGHEVLFNEFQFDREQMKMLNLTYELDELKRKLQSMSPFYDGDLVDIFRLKTQEEQFEAIIRKMESYRQANDVMESFEDTIAKGAKGGSMFRESFITNLNDYAQTLNNIGNNLRSMREKGLLTEDMLLAFNDELGGSITGRNIAEKIESLRQYFVKTLSMSDEDRYQLYQSWSSGLQDAYVKSMNLAGIMRNSKYLGNPLSIFDFFKKSAVTSDSDVKKNLDRMAEVYKPMLEMLDDFDARAGLIRNVFSNFVADSKISEADSKVLFDYFIESIDNQLNNGDGVRFLAKDFMDEFSKEMQEQVKNNKKWTLGEAFDASLPIIEKLAESWKKAGRDISSFYTQVFIEGLQNSTMSMVGDRDEWQKKLQGATKDETTGLWNYSQFYKDWGQKMFNVSETETLSSFFGETMKKEHDDIAKEIENMFKPASTVWGITIEPELRVKTANLDKLNEVRKQVQKRLEIGNGQAPLSPEAREGLIEFEKRLGHVISLEEEAKRWGFLYGDDKKTGTGYHDEYAKRWDERIRIMKEAYDWYDKWEKKVGESEAFKKVDERYRDIFDEWKTDKILPFDFQATDIKDYFSYVEQIRDQALAKYQEQKNDESKNNGQEALRVYRQAVAVLEEGGYDNFIRAAEKFQSIMEKTMDDLQRRWSLFTDIRDKTGNVGLAATLSGVDTSFRTQADAMRAAVQNAYTEAGGEGEVNFDISLDKDAVRAMFEGAIRGDKTDAKYMESIDGLIKGFEEWQKSEEEQEKMDINVTVDLLGSAVDLQSEVQKIATNYNSQLDSLNRQFPNRGAAYDKAKGILDANTQNKLVQAQEAYKLLIDGVITMNIGAARDVREAYVNTLNRQLTTGAITAKQYADQIDAINDRMQALENLQSYQRSYMEQGVSGATDNLAQRGKSLIEQGAAIMEMGSQTMNSEMVKMGQYMIQTGQGMKKASQDMNQTVSVISLIVNGINNMVQSLKGVWDEINSTLQAYGDDTQKYGMGRKVGTFLSSFAEASQGATDAFEALKSGNGAGVLLGVVKSWTSWFRGFAKGNDEENALYRANAESAIKNYGNIRSSLQSDKERSFGYAQMGSYGLRGIANARYNEKILRSFYGSGNWSDATLEAMTSALQSGSAYAGEYATLMAELDSRQNQLSSLESDKDKDQDEIEATKKQIAELEDQIAHFTEDLAKDLWGIDVKSWANQINDALMNAFENGENAAKAYQDTVRSIMQNVTSQIMKMSIIQPMMEKLQKILFGTKDEKGNLQGGVVSTDDLIKDPTGAAKKLVQASNQFFANEGNAMITAAREFYEGMNTGLGGILTNPNANTLSSSIQGTAEETSDLLAGYVSALRQDVAADRIMREQFISEMWPTFVKETMGAVITPLNNIDRNVAAIRQSMTGQGDLMITISDIYDILNAITNGTKEVHMA